MSEPFRYFFRVRYGECDAQKVVFNARYGDYIDISITEFLRAIGYEQEIVSGELDFQLVKQTTQWKASARYDDVIEARVKCTGIGNTSFMLAATFYRAADAVLLCESETVYVRMDHATMRKCVVDAHLRVRLEQGAKGKKADHANYLTK